MVLSFVYFLQSVLGDIYEREFNSPWCNFLGYIYAVCICISFLSFINQAFFRLCRIIYPQYKYLQSSQFYFLIIPIEIIIAFILLCPIYVWNDINYLPDDHFCFVPLSNIRGYLWILFTAYTVPVSSLFFMYIRIVIYIRKQSNLTIRDKQRQARDFNAIRRILTVVGFLMFCGMPVLIFVIRMFITGEVYPLTNRIMSILIGISMFGLSIAMVLCVSQLKDLLWKTLKVNQATSVTRSLTNSVQLRIYR
ncbi:hypothetical protein I4U23_010551 [Adineta vaga]|nr:hypothetical protein I4U23_010551 [Adineta vaga]